MNAIARLDQPIRPPTLAEPIPSLAGTRGLNLLKSATARMLVQLSTMEDADLLRETCEAVLRSLWPATPLEMGAVLEALALHYPQFRRTDGETRIATRQWAQDLAGWPCDLIEEAARLWRNSPAERYPTPGQFKKQLADVFAHRQALGRRAQAYLDELRGVRR